MKKYHYGTLHDRADRFNKMVRNRCRDLSIQAGLDPNLLGIHPHNAMCSYDYGNPWPGVDYKIVRKILWLLRDYQWRAHRIVDSLYEKGLLYFNHPKEDI